MYKQAGKLAHMTPSFWIHRRKHSEDAVNTAAVHQLVKENRSGAQIYVGNLSFRTVESDLMAYFGEIGTVISCTICRLNTTGKSRGFGFVVMSDQDAATKAIAKLKGKKFMKRVLEVHEVRAHHK
jgi:RNA recognition motif-containing protein